MFLPRRILTPRYPSVLPRARRSKCRTFRNDMEVRSRMIAIRYVRLTPIRDSRLTRERVKST